MDYNFPSGLNYTTTHEWVDTQNSIATVGITDYAQHQLGDIVFVELPEVGVVFEKESHAGEIESVKAVGDLIMPLSGEIKEGKLADLLLIDLKKINLNPNHNLISNLVYSGNGNCVSETICDGKILMQNRKVKDEEEIIQKANEIAFDLIRKV